MNPVPTQPDFWTWIGPAAVLVGAYFLRNLHTKIEKSVSKDDFEKAMNALKLEHETDVATLRNEHSRDREELKREQQSVQIKLDLQQQLLTKVATTVDLLFEFMKENRHVESAFARNKQNFGSGNS